MRVVAPLPTQRPDPHGAPPAGSDIFDPGTWNTKLGTVTAGADGTIDSQRIAPSPADDTGIYALARADLFNLLVIPPVSPSYATGAGAQRVLPADVKGRAAAFCHAHRALFLVDPDPDWDEPRDLTTVTTAPNTVLDDYITNISGDDRRNAALYFPYLRAPDPLQRQRGRRVPAVRLRSPA